MLEDKLVYDPIERSTSTLDDDIYVRFFRDIGDLVKTARDSIANFYESQDPIYANEIRTNIIEFLEEEAQYEAHTVKQLLHKYPLRFLVGTAFIYTGFALATNSSPFLGVASAIAGVQLILSSSNKMKTSIRNIKSLENFE